MAKGSLRKLIAKNIKEIRARLELTQEQAAEKAGFHYKYYQKIESGSVNLTIDSIEQISKAFKTSPKDLLS